MFQKHGQYEQQSKLLTDLIIYLEDVLCRHKQIMTYYVEDRDAFQCSTSCDNCKTSDHYIITDGASDALKVVQAVVELSGKKLTFNSLKLYLAGSNQKCIQENNLNDFSTYGILKYKFVPVSMLQRFMNLLLHCDILTEVVTSNNNLCLNVTLGTKAHQLWIILFIFTSMKNFKCYCYRELL